LLTDDEPLSLRAKSVSVVEVEPENDVGSKAKRQVPSMYAPVELSQYSCAAVDFGLMVKLPVVLPAKPQYQSPSSVLRKRYARLETPKGATSLPHSA
jgi:hypothetical protein